MRIGLLAPPWIPIPPPAYGGIERVIALQAAGLAAAGHQVTLVAAPGSAVPGVEVVSPLESVPAQIGLATDEWRHVLGGLDALSGADMVIDHSGPLGALLSAQGSVPSLHVMHGSLEGVLLELYNGLAARAPGNPERAAVRPRTAILDRPDVLVRTAPEGLGRACGRSLTDLDALSIPDDLDPSRRLLAAGIPWFVALFGRDALISGYQARAFRPELLLDTLGALAARQGSRDDPGNGEQPGKILHEVRFGDQPWLGEGTVAGARPYYGSADSTPLFLIMLGEAMRWGAPTEALTALLPAARAALGWLRGPADPDRDGLVEYSPNGPRSLVNQGWKDSENAVQFADGRLADPPIAVVEVQGYAYRARQELASVLAHLGQRAEAADLTAEADQLRELIRRRYWRPGTGAEPGSFAMALDGDKQQVDSIASNMAHLLWCGVPSQSEAEQVAARLTGPALASGWGLRTLSDEMAGFNPISYHVGSVWPHDTVLACEGLRRYQLDEAAMALVGDLLDALAIFDDRLPELFGGHRREPGDFPVPYPTACRPQAWAAGVPLAIVALCLGLQPDTPAGSVSLDPVLPRNVRRLEAHGIQLPGGELSGIHDAQGTKTITAPPGLRIELAAR
ncbi:MAG: glycosyltransferase [Pseudonocardiales bacterium]|nr:glycosyltransferase [Pseudonocardiales bacterium]